MNPKVDFFFDKAEKWREAFEQLRPIPLECGLTEELKWGCPCYSLDKQNVVLIHGFKEYCALLFFKGVLMPDPSGILIQQTPHVQVARQVRFTHVSEIVQLKPVLKAYILNAIELETSGVKPELKKTADFAIPAEFQYQLDHIPALKIAFEALTPGRQKGYLLYFSQPKQSKTRQARIEKFIPQILNGKGVDD